MSGPEGGFSCAEGDLCTVVTGSALLLASRVARGTCDGGVIGAVSKPRWPNPARPASNWAKGETRRGTDTTSPPIPSFCMASSVPVSTGATVEVWGGTSAGMSPSPPLNRLGISSAGAAMGMSGALRSSMRHEGARSVADGSKTSVDLARDPSMSPGSTVRASTGTFGNGSRKTRVCRGAGPFEPVPCMSKSATSLVGGCRKATVATASAPGRATGIGTCIGPIDRNARVPSSSTNSPDGASAKADRKAAGSTAAWVARAGAPCGPGKPATAPR